MSIVREPRWSPRIRIADVAGNDVHMEMRHLVAEVKKVELGGSVVTLHGTRRQANAAIELCMVDPRSGEEQSIPDDSYFGDVAALRQLIDELAPTPAEIDAGRLVSQGTGPLMAMFDPADMTQARFNRYGPSGLPNTRDDEVADFIDGLVTGGPAAVARVLPRVTEQARQILRSYAERMASLAVRRRDRAVLLRAVVALVVGGLDENRPESLMVMAPIEDSATRVGIELSELLEDASKVVGHPATVNLMLWLTRKDEDRSLASMGYITSDDADGFRYQLNW